MTSKSETVPAVSSIVTSSTIGSGSLSGTAGSSSSSIGFGSPWSSNFMSITTMRLNGCNYLPWAKSVEVFLRVNTRYQYLTDEPLEFDDPTFAAWDAKDSQIRLRMWNSMKPTIVVV